MQYVKTITYDDMLHVLAQILKRVCVEREALEAAESGTFKEEVASDRYRTAGEAYDEVVNATSLLFSYDKLKIKRDARDLLNGTLVAAGGETDA
ncbi:MAG: hypothetical protein V8T51_08580 [Senegalimassilia faecalis]